MASELAAALSDRGHQVHVVAEKKPLRLRSHTRVSFHPFEVFDYPLFPVPPHDLCLITKLTDLCQEFKPHIIHAHYAVPHALAALIAREAASCRNTGLVTTLHGTDVTLVGSHPSFYTLTKYAMERADCVTVVSSWLLKKTAETFHLKRKPVVIPNFVNPAEFHSHGRVGYPEGEPFELVHASNFRPVKRVTDIVRAFHLISQEVPARLTLVGDGPDSGAARELVAELGLTDRVRFPGPAPTLGSLFRESHLYLLLSDYESFGVSALEAMACGVPCVVSNAGGLPEVVRSGETGFLCRVGDFRCAARQALRIIKDRATWERMSEAASKWAHAAFSVSSIIPRYEELYRSLIGSV